MARAVQTTSRARLSEQYIRDEFFIMSTVGNTREQDEALADAAAGVWMDIWHPPHEYPTKRRRVAAVPQRSGTLKAWHDARRACVDGLVATNRNDPSDAHGGCAPGDDGAWTGKHAKEEDFQRRKRLQRALAAFREGSMLSDECVAEFGGEDVARRVSDAVAAEEARRQSKYLKQQEGQRKVRTSMPPMELNGLPVWVQRGASGIPKLVATIDAHGLVAVPQRETAQAFVVVDVTSPGQRVLWNVCLRGGLLISAHYFLQGEGPLLQYDAAFGRGSKCLFLSSRFRAAHPVIHHIVVSAAAGMTSRGTMKWDVYQEAEKPIFLKRSKARCVALLTGAEAESCGEFKGMRLLTVRNAIEYFARVSRDMSSTGICNG